MDSPPEPVSNSPAGGPGPDPSAEAAATERAAEREARQRGGKPSVAGRVGCIPRTGFRALLRWISGWALISWLGRLLVAAVGVRRMAEVELVERTLVVSSRTELLGRVIGEAEQILPLDSLHRASRLVRYPALHLAVGAVSLSAGILLGGLWALDGIFSRDPVLAAAALVALLGAALDLSLDIWAPGRGNRVAVEIETSQGYRLRLVRVPLDDADRFFQELGRRLQERPS